MRYLFILTLFISVKANAELYDCYRLADGTKKYEKIELEDDPRGNIYLSLEEFQEKWNLECYVSEHQ